LYRIKFDFRQNNINNETTNNSNSDDNDDDGNSFLTLYTNVTAAATAVWLSMVTTTLPLIVSEAELVTQTILQRRHSTLQHMTITRVSSSLSPACVLRQREWSSGAVRQ